ncbi:MAG: amino acid ABC transporter substrate-binding protein [Sphingobacteriales bacterium]|nr:amino acid ABC transporter substrate-binding protein [Sphingobacteriales bacterium]
MVTNLFNADSSLQRYDLMIGPVYTKQLNVAADFALKHKVPMVSPLSPRVQGIVQNPYFFNANPTTTSHFKAMYDYISKHWTTSDIILITSNADQDANAANELSVIFNNAAVSEHRYINIKKINSESPTFSTDLQNALAVGRENIVIAAIFEEKQAKSICSKLSGNSVILWTMPTWDSMENLNLEILESLKVYQSTSFFYDESNPEQVAFRTAYRQRYHIFPSEYACKGYDMTHYFVDLLFKKGKNISQNLASANKKGIFCDYDFVPSLLGVSNNSVIAKPDFYENKSLKIIKFEGYEYILAP